MQHLTLIQHITIWAIPVLLAITLHEASHAFVANYCGDTTAKRLGRMSLNPLRHIDPIGTLLIPIIVAIASSFNFIFGYAKPVPINWSQLRNPRRDMALVALAGPLSNFIMALIWASLFKAATFFHPQSSIPALYLLLTSQAGIIINLVLGFLNMIPLPPLDGSKIIMSFLKPRHAMAYSKIEPYGFIILLLMLFTGLLSLILTPLINVGVWILSTLFSI